MITLNNYQDVIKEIGLDSLNDGQREAHDLIVEGSEDFKNMGQMDEMLEDPDIKEVIDIYFGQLEMLRQNIDPPKKEPKPKKKKVDRSTPKKKVTASKKTIRAKKSTTNKKESNPKKTTRKKTTTSKKTATKSKKKTTTKKPRVKVVKVKPPKAPVTVRRYSKEMQLIKSFVNIEGKDKTDRSMSLLKNRIDNAFKADHIKDHVSALNEIKSKVNKFNEAAQEHKLIKPEIDKEFLEKCRGIIQGASVRMRTEYLAGVKKKTKKSKPGIKIMPHLAGFVTADQVDKIKAPETFRLSGELGNFLGELQRYMLAIKLEGESHAGKTQVAYQIADALIDKGYTVGALDYEQGGLESKDTQKTIERNVKPKNRQFLAVTGKIAEGDRLSQVKNFAKKFDVILLDSWQSLKEITSQRFNELREEHPGTIFIVVFQKNSQGTTKGGASSHFDAPVAIDCFLVEEDFPNYNYAKLTKNRGNVLGKYYNIVQKKTFVGAPLLPKPTKEEKKEEAPKA